MLLTVELLAQPKIENSPVYLDYKQPLDIRVADLVSKMTVEEKVSQMMYNIPKNQIDFLKKLRKDNTKPVIAVVTGGSPMNLSEVTELADAVLLVWYPGEEGGKAVANVLFGDVSPSGKLPITFPKLLDQLPPYEDY